MKKTFVKIASCLTMPALGLLVLTTGPGALAQSATPNTSVENLEKQIQELKQTLEELKKTSPTNSGTAGEETPTAAVTTPARRAVTDPNDPVERIRDEGMNRSQVMKTLSYLTDVIGPRLTGSPNLKHANEWTRDTLKGWGLVNAAVEPWGTFGRGWELKRYSAEVVEPYDFTVIGAPKAWSPGLKKPVVSEVVYLGDVRTEADLDKYKGKLKNAIVLTSAPRNVPLFFDPISARFTDAELTRMASATGGGGSPLTGRRSGGNGGTNAAAGGPGRRGAGTNAAAAGGPGGRRGGGGANIQGRILAFMLKEGAAVAVSPSGQGDSGTIFVSDASLPAPEPRGTNAPGGQRGATATNTPTAGGGRRGGPRISDLNAPPTPPQIMLATEDYNRLVRMVQQGAKVKMAVNLETEYYTKDPLAYDTVAEIPGTDLKDELVMLGGHMDSWQSGTGATDNGAGVAVAMEVVRILKALDLKPRRTIRIALWTGEEQGLLGSRGYVNKHFGYMTNQPGGDGTRMLVKGPEYDKLSSYYNLDNGSGKIRGIYLQGNAGARDLFTKWLEPFHDLGAQTVTIRNTSGTDHQSFDGIGLPGFQFIQDPLDYETRTHHSNEDVYDRAQANDLKQAATIMAAFVYQAANLDEKIPRKALSTAPAGGF